MLGAQVKFEAHTGSVLYEATASIFLWEATDPVVIFGVESSIFAKARLARGAEMITLGR